MALAFSCRRNARSCILQLLHCIDSSTISPSLEAPKRPDDTLRESFRVIGGTPSSLSFAASFAKGGREGRAGVHGFSVPRQQMYCTCLPTSNPAVLFNTHTRSPHTLHPASVSHLFPLPAPNKNSAAGGVEVEFDVAPTQRCAYLACAQGSL